MHKWINECTNEWMNAWMNEWMHEWINAWMNKCTNDWMNECMNECMHEWIINKSINPGIHEWMNEWLPAGSEVSTVLLYRADSFIASTGPFVQLPVPPLTILNSFVSTGFLGMYSTIGFSYFFPLKQNLFAFFLWYMFYALL